MAKRLKSFGDYKADGNVWITLTTGEYYPDILVTTLRMLDERLTKDWLVK